MNPKYYALAGGIFMVLFAALSLIPEFSRSPLDAGLPPLYVESSYGEFLGLFPMNILNKLALLVFGVAGILSATAKNTSLPRSVRWSRWAMGVMGALAVLGIIPSTNTLFGYWPLFGGEVWMHGVFAVLGAYFGYALTQKAASEVHRRFPDSDQTRKAG